MRLIAGFLITPDDDLISSSVVKATVKTIRERRGVMPLVLAETLSGFDYVTLGRSTHFSGSHLLLQVWLM